ncbi:NUDIX hydrolase [Streptomyces justiciae]|uniref:NUDIX domain-containing protein n=1 Tax=Streptomyces justiciae TaxID=2780140 RepID=A0ABU3LWC7_9ACTN|nr:NUDIX domain-containing protein [Streptomyces justiciae]MDT7843541.1 NUDIX domain-containing protein [Streptomyces justiciae]
MGISPTVSLIGSFRKHYPEVKAAAQVFSDAGIVVKAPPISRIVNPGREYARFESDCEQCSDHAIQAATMEKIFNSDFVYVVNPGGYIGRSTAYELGRVHERGLAVFYAEPPKDLPIDVPESAVIDASDLAAAIGENGVVPSRVRRPRVAALQAADIVIFTLREERLHVLLIERGKEPYRGMRAIPGGFVRPGESLEDAARRELREETGLADPPLRQLGTYSKPERDPRGRVVSTVFLAIQPNLSAVTGGTDADDANWVEVEESMWRDGSSLAFDHAKILQDALERTRNLLELTTVAVDFCEEPFTISELRKVYEAVWGVELNPGNFQRQVRETKGFVVETTKKSTSRMGKPATLFRRGQAEFLRPPMLRPVKRGPGSD